MTTGKNDHMSGNQYRQAIQGFSKRVSRFHN